MSITPIYFTRATATGGRDGSAKSEDGRLDVNLSVPKAMGGDDGPGTNPEQLFAAGYSACFIGAMGVAAREMGANLPSDVSVSAKIGIGPRGEGGFGITADLEVHIPGMDKDTAETLVNNAHQICPYSNATRNNIDVGLTVV